MLPIINTCSGLHFDYGLQNNPISIDDIAGALSRICRFNGHLRPDVEFYSVAQHSVIVSYLVPAPFAFLGLMHDAAEAYVGDMPSPLKMLLPDFKRAEYRAHINICDHFGLPTFIPDEVLLADKIALATERRDLLTPTGEAWHVLEGIEPTQAVIEPLLPKAARDLFMGRYLELVGKFSPTMQLAIEMPYDCY